MRLYGDKNRRSPIEQLYKTMLIANGPFREKECAPSKFV